MQFEEQQYFRQPWLIAVLIFVVLSTIVAVVMAAPSRSARYILLSIFSPV